MSVRASSQSLSSASSGSSSGQVVVTNTANTAVNPSANASPVTVGNVTTGSIRG